MKFDKDGNHMVTGTIVYLGTFKFTDKWTRYQQVELLLDSGEHLRLNEVSFCPETRRVVEINSRVTLYFTAVTDRHGAAKACDVWVARDEHSGRVFVRENLAEIRSATLLQCICYLVLSPAAVLIFFVGFFAALFFSWACYKSFKLLPTQGELDAVADVLREQAQAHDSEDNRALVAA
jgi:hypothetical protein